ERLGDAVAVVDLVYAGGETPLIAEARKRGAVAVDGLEVLVRQGAESLRIWTGREPPLGVMREAARGEGWRRGTDRGKPLARHSAFDTVGDRDGSPQRPRAVGGGGELGPERQASARPLPPGAGRGLRGDRGHADRSRRRRAA